MSVNKLSVINVTAEYVREILGHESTGHDWWHVRRVWKMSMRITKEEKDVDLFVVQLAALLHDIEDWKFRSHSYYVGPKLARKWLEDLEVEEDVISHVCKIIKDMSFKGAKVKSQMTTKEGMIVQDADRLDAVGALGIARCFATGAKRDQPIYDSNIKPRLQKTVKEYIGGKTTSINHFYEKLLLLKDMMNTKTAKKLVMERHRFMEQFLDRFFAEWNGTR